MPDHPLSRSSASGETVPGSGNDPIDRVHARSSEVESHPYRYEATIKLIITADGLHAAVPFARLAADLARQTHPCSDAALVSADASVVDVKHRPDLDGSLRA